jgi:hypothetical protein
VRQFGLYPSWAQEACGESAPVREDRAGWIAGEPVGLPGPELGSYIQTGEALNASKREAAPKTRLPTRQEPSEDPSQKSWWLDRRWTPGNRCSQAGLMIVRLVCSQERAGSPDVAASGAWSVTLLLLSAARLGLGKIEVIMFFVWAQSFAPILFLDCQ